MSSTPTDAGDSADRPDSRVADRAAGALSLTVLLLMILRDWGGPGWAGDAAAALAAALLLLLAPQVRWSRRLFVVIGLALVAAAMATRASWLADVDRALQSAAFIAAFFSALTSLRHVADTSPAIHRAGRFLAQQPPGRRYLALTAGGQVFGLLLNYGAIALLGSMSVTSAGREPDPQIRAIRVRRMLMAIQRGFTSTLAWSPLGFAMAVSTTLVPGASWAAALPACLVTAALLAAVGWALDTVFKPRLPGPRPAPPRPEGGWRTQLPLLWLLLLLVIAVGGLHLAAGVRAVGVVIVVVPLIALGWTMLQAAPGARLRATGRRGRDYLLRDLPGYRGELVLLMTAGFIGALGAALLVPVVRTSGLDLSAVPGWAVLLALVWLIPLTGQLGMNPILTASLLIPVLPSAAQMGVTPTEVIVAVTGGWALSGASSPYTASTLMIGTLARVEARRVGMVWNGGYVLAGGLAVSAWVLLLALVPG
ncbi:hypothetical protein [Halovulum marinum]|uniref:hypothetical protein n=1 Tax=Halovulum marinum TaxID=2662447 RepID=UPI0012B425C3|nr:hypothetical protein [Halovulum marinum]